MMKAFWRRVMLLVVCLSAAVGGLCVGPVRAATVSGGEPKVPEADKVQAEAPTASEAGSISAVIVGKIGEYVITRGELEKRLMSELQPYGYEEYDEDAKPIDAATALLKMISEKAMIMEARKQGLLNDEAVRSSIEQYRNRRLVNLLLQKQLQGKLTVTESEIDAQMKSDAKLDRARARQMVERGKANAILDAYYKQIHEKSRVETVTENLGKAAEIHRRLLYYPKTDRNVGFIRVNQVREELTPEEKALVLASYEGGKLTLKDWFDALFEFSPPSRPKDLNTPGGVERFLQRISRMPILVVEAERVGLDKDANLLKQVREYEDQRLFGEIMGARSKEVKEPTEEQMQAYYKQNREVFRFDRSIKIDQIWCENLAAAKRARAELDGGGDFEAVKQKYSLDKQSKAFYAYPGGESFFWKDLWKGEPNEVVGPLKGTYQQAFKWRVVKVLDKKPGQVKDYSDGMQGRVKGRMMSERRKALLEEYRKDLLAKYEHEVYAERIKDIRPLDIP
jgi:hypothetical protein